MSTLVWSALGFLLFVLLAGTVTTAALALAAWRRLRSAQRAGAAALGGLADSLETLQARAEEVSGGAGELGGAAARLATSLHRARVLLAALQEVREAIALAGAFASRR